VPSLPEVAFVDVEPPLSGVNPAAVRIELAELADCPRTLGTITLEEDEAKYPTRPKVTSLLRL
jgi:hypothetical protein